MLDKITNKILTAVLATMDKTQFLGIIVEGLNFEDPVFKLEQVRNSGNAKIW